MWTRLAKQAAVTETEVAGAILVPRLMKMATVAAAAARLAQGDPDAAQQLPGSREDTFVTALTLVNADRSAPR